MFLWVPALLQLAATIRYALALRLNDQLGFACLSSRSLMLVGPSPSGRQCLRRNSNDNYRGLGVYGTVGLLFNLAGFE